MRSNGGKFAHLSEGFVAPNAAGEGGKRPTRVASLRGALLSGAKLEQAVMQGVNLSACQMGEFEGKSAATLCLAQLQGAIFM